MNYNDTKMKVMLVDMLGWFHDFCVANELKYYVLGGTMLGTVRHQGFIPWDDDIDVGLPRPDYERLCTLLKNQKKERYILETPYTDAQDFYYTYSKLYDTTTTLVEHKRIDVVRGIFIDIFPLDGLGDTLDTCKLEFNKINIYFSLLTARTVAVRKGRAPIKNVASIIAKSIPESILDSRKLVKKIDLMCKKNDYTKYKYGGNLMSPWRFKEVMDQSIMGKPTLYKFENIEVFGPEHYEEYLTHLYGDWRKLPPEERRISHHDYVSCNLEEPFQINCKLGL